MTMISRRGLLRRILQTGSMLGATALLSACNRLLPSPTAPLPPPATPLPATSTLPPTAETGTVTPAATATIPALPADKTILKGVTDVSLVAQLTGEKSLNDTGKQWGVYGCDLGHMFDQGDTLYMVFGDSYGCCIPGTGGPGNASDWRYNLMAVISDRNPKDGLTFDSMISDKSGHAKQLIARSKFDKTIIPTNGVAVGSRLFLHYMAVLAWGNPGKWTLNESGIAYSDDGGNTWTKDPNAKWEDNSNFGQVAFVKSDNDLYLFGIPGGRFGGVKLAKVPQDKLLDKSAYRYFSGSNGSNPQWSAEESAAVLIVPPTVGELSVMWNAYLGRWIMTYLDEMRGSLVIREAENLWGPWSAYQPLVSGTQYSGLYGAYLHPWYVENDGEIIYFTMSQWGPYNVYWMKARLKK